MNTSYVAAVIGSSASADKFHLGLFNAVGSCRILRVHRVYVVSHLTATNNGTGTSFTLLRTSTSGTGTSSAFRKTDLRSIDPPSQVSALMSYSVNPTAVSNSELAEQTISTEEGSSSQSFSTPLWNDGEIILREGEGLTVRQSALGSAGAVSVFIHFNLRGEVR